ncbi:MAG: hypothetical protein HQL88_05200 [Magnetococcales bacterium]|nr:hypothetical protein [Magnetococcales bacterium]
MEKLKEQLEAAISESRNWAVRGWKMQFGPHGRSVDSLRAALDTPLQSSRQESLAYWQMVEGIGQETAIQGEKARRALDGSDWAAAHNALFLAVFLERKVRKEVPTWGPLLTALEAEGQR